ncbi:MAG: aldehyde dehydrogenase family protein [Planctomycetota bacterium]
MNARHRDWLPESFPYYLANEAVHANRDLAVVDKFDGTIATHVARADADAIERAIAAAAGCRDELRRWPAWRRKRVLEHVVKRLGERRDELAKILAVEAGKPLNDARGEIERGMDTFTLAVEESTRIGGEWMPLDISERAEGYRSFWQRVPIGPVSFISPFNFPINLTAHKIAPAIAAGCPFVLKPASRTPISALVLGEILAETDLPKGAFSILPAERAAADALTEDERLKLLSFTGSPDVGWALKARAGKKKVVLELGGNAACIVDRDADLEHAVERIVVGAFYQSGQSCIGVQRILVHSAVIDEVRAKLVERILGLVQGDPLDEATFLGPLISEGDSERVAEWIAEAVAGGARVLVGGTREGSFHAATLVEDCPRDLRLEREEVFGPVATLAPFDSFEEAIARTNDSAYGLQAGIFTRDFGNAMYAFDELEVGGVVLNDVPSVRVDAMPYGGVKDSGLGREGVRFAIEDLTERRLFLWRSMGPRPK